MKARARSDAIWVLDVGSVVQNGTSYCLSTPRHLVPVKRGPKFLEEEDGTAGKSSRL